MGGGAGTGGGEGVGEGVGTGDGEGVGMGTVVLSGLQASKENNAPAVAALNPRATICRIKSRRDISISASLLPVETVDTGSG